MSLLERLFQFVESLSRIDQYSELSFWENLVNEYFSDSASLILDLLSEHSGHRKSYELKKYAIPKFFYSCFLSRLAKMQFAFMDPKSLYSKSSNISSSLEDICEIGNVHWIFLYHQDKKIWFTGTLSLKPSSNNHHLFEKFHYHVEQSEEFIQCAVGYHNSHESIDIQSVDENPFDYGFSQKTMRYLDMIEMWTFMTDIIDASILSPLSPNLSLKEFCGSRVPEINLLIDNKSESTTMSKPSFHSVLQWPPLQSQLPNSPKSPSFCDDDNISVHSWGNFSACSTLSSHSQLDIETNNIQTSEIDNNSLNNSIDEFILGAPIIEHLNYILSGKYKDKVGCISSSLASVNISRPDSRPSLPLDHPSITNQRSFDLSLSVSTLEGSLSENTTVIENINNKDHLSKRMEVDSPELSSNNDCRLTNVNIQLMNPNVFSICNWNNYVPDDQGNRLSTVRSEVYDQSPINIYKSSSDDERVSHMSHLIPETFSTIRSVPFVQTKELIGSNVYRPSYVSSEYLSSPHESTFSSMFDFSEESIFR